MVKPLSFVVAFGVLPLVANAFALLNDSRPLVDSKKLRRSIKATELQRHARLIEDIAVFKGDGNRAFGGPGHDGTVRYLYDEVSKLSQYYDVWLQPFTERYSAATGNFLVDGEQEIFYPARGSPPAKELKAQLVAAKGEGCNAEDFTGSSFKGKIVLVKRGNCTITYKAQMSSSSGAVGVIVYNVSISALNNQEETDRFAIYRV